MKATKESGLPSQAAAGPHVDEVLTSLLARAFATVDLATTTVRLAVAETRLALSSAGFIAGFAALLLVMVLVTWLVALATAFAALQALGLSALWALSTLLLTQLIICLLLVHTLIRLSRNMTFPLTRQALRPSAHTD